MEQQRKPTGAIIAAVLLLLPLLYLASYLALVEPRGVLYRSSTFTLPAPAGSPLMSVPTFHYYRYGGSFSETLFSPLEQIDQMLFPERWLDQRILPGSSSFEIYEGPIELPETPESNAE